MTLANRIHRLGSGDRLVGREGDRRAVLDAAAGLRSDDGAARAVAESPSPDTVVASSRVLLALTGYETALARRRCLVHRLRAGRRARRPAVAARRSRATGSESSWSSASCFFVAQMTAVLVLAEVGEADEPVAEETTTERRRRPRPRRPPPRRPPQTEPTETETTAAARRCRRGQGGLPGRRPAARAATRSPTPDRRARSGRISTRSSRPTTRSSSQVTNGGGGMPPFEDTLTEQQIQDVAAYVSSVDPGLDPPAPR